MSKTSLQPVYPEYFADPYVWRHEGIYYAVGTSAASAAGGPHPDDRVIPLLRSTDLRDWTFVHSALLRPDLGLGGEFWAPAVAFRDGMFYLYYSVGQGSEGICHQLRVATSDRPEGPYADSGTPLLLPGDETIVFDPDPFRDEDGQWYLFYDRNYFDVTSEGRAGDAISVRRLENMTRLSSEATPILRPNADWERTPERDYGGKRIDWHTVEGASVVRRWGRYYCFYSGSAWQTESYGVDYVTADTILGPYRSDAAPDEAPRVLCRGENLRGPGHCMIVVGPDGVTDHIVFHAWDAEMQRRQMYVEPLVWTKKGPRLAAFVG